MNDPVAYPAALPSVAETPFDAPRVGRFTLANGLEIWIARRRSLPLATVQLVARGGRAYDPTGLPGLAGILAAALKEGTARRSAASLADLVQAAGAELVTGASEETLAAGVTGLSEKLDVLLDAVADVVRRPAFPERDVARVKAIAREELATDESDPFFLANRAFRASVFGGHPYAVVAPTATAIDAVTPELLRREAARRLSPSRSLLVVAGDVEPGDAESLAARVFGDWAPATEGPGPLDPAPLRLAGPRFAVVPRPGSVQATLVVGAPALSRRNPDAAALEVAVTIFGGAFSSRLVTNLREDKGYTYSPGSGWRSLPSGGLTRTVAAVRTDVAGAALNEILYELRRMATTDVTDEELERAKGCDAGKLLLAIQTNAGLAGELGEQWFHGLPPSALEERVRALRAVDAAAVRRAARRFLGVPALAVVAVGEEAALREELAPFGA